MYQNDKRLIDALSDKKFSIADMDGLRRAIVAAFLPRDRQEDVWDSLEIDSFSDNYPSLKKHKGKLFTSGGSGDGIGNKTDTILNAIIHSEYKRGNTSMSDIVGALETAGMTLTHSDVLLSWKPLPARTRGKVFKMFTDEAAAEIEMVNTDYDLVTHELEIMRMSEFFRRYNALQTKQGKLKTKLKRLKQRKTRLAETSELKIIKASARAEKIYKESGVK